MNRDLAIAVLKEIFDRCPDIFPSAITLMTVSPKGTGYHIHISAILDEDSRATLQEIATKYHLTFRERDGRIQLFEYFI